QACFGADRPGARLLRIDPAAEPIVVDGVRTAGAEGERLGQPDFARDGQQPAIARAVDVVSPEGIGYARAEGKYTHGPLESKHEPDQRPAQAISGKHGCGSFPSIGRTVSPASDAVVRAVS